MKFVVKKMSARFLIILTLAVTTVLFANRVLAAPVLSRKELSLRIGKTTSVKLKNTKAEISWSQTGKSIVEMRQTNRNTVKITAIKAGTAKIYAKTEKKTYVCKVTVLPYQYLAIGNSLTWHPVCDFWWKECGMAASSPEKDYVHQVQKGLKKKYGRAEMEVVSAGLWEISAAAKKQMLDKLELLLEQPRDLITIQMGENIPFSGDFSSGLTQMIRLIKQKNPGVTIVLVSNFLNRTTGQRTAEQIKKKVVVSCKVRYANISAIVGKSAYSCGFGRIFYDSRKIPHRVTNAGVAEHPNDQGMLYIAQRILAVI